MIVMLRNGFSVADPLVREFLDHKPTPDSSSWFEYCYRNGWSVEDMMSEFEGWKADRVTIDHDPSPRREAPLSAHPSQPARLVSPEFPA